MRLSSISIENYKSFLEPQTIDIGDGFNLFIGANNSGKTTMLDALELDAGKNTLHRSMLTMPNFGIEPKGNSSLSVAIKTSIEELREFFGNVIYIPLPQNYKDLLHSTQPDAVSVFNRLSDSPEIIIHISCGCGLEIVSANTIFGSSERINVHTNTSRLVLQLNYSNRTEIFPECTVINISGRPGPMQFSEVFKKFLYRFSSHRRPNSASSFTSVPAVLDSEAINLAFCLSQLQLNDAHGHNIFCRWVRQVFPSVLWVQAPSKEGNRFQIELLPCAAEDRRNDLAVPLSQMGTGIGHVLAILYIVLTSRQPQVIAIDEPNSFLHPKALRQLLQILSVEGAQHQYILTAHSADVLTAVQPSLVTMFNTDDGQTKTHQVKARDISDLRAKFSELGIRMTDLHGRDLVLWVEGQTEELIMPSLLRHFCPEIAAGTAVLRVEHTGRFEKKGLAIMEVASSYERLTSSSLVPPMVAILLDREKREKSDCKRLERETKGKLRFLEETMIENYFLNVQAIVAVLKSHGENIPESTIQTELNRHLTSDATIDGAKILREIFIDLSNARVEFCKTRDVPRIVSWLLENDPQHLEKLGIFLRAMFKSWIELY